MTGKVADTGPPVPDAATMAISAPVLPSMT